MTDRTRTDRTRTDRTRTDRTDSDGRANGDGRTAPEYRPTLGEMTHTNPYTDQAFGDTQTYGRGKIVAADGGRAGSTDGAPDDRDGTATSEADPDIETLSEVSHTPPGDAAGAQAVHDRGAADE